MKKKRKTTFGKDLHIVHSTEVSKHPDSISHQLQPTWDLHKLVDDMSVQFIQLVERVLSGEIKRNDE